MPFRRLPSLLSLRVFEAVARHGSFKAAADELHVTAGALSQQVKNLEEDLGIELFVRLNREIRLTEAGGILSIGLTDAFVQVREAVERVRPRSGNKMIVVSCGPPFASKWLAPRLHRFTAEWPELDVRVVSTFDNSELGPGGVDVAVRLSERLDLTLYHEHLVDETVLPLACPGFIEEQQLREPRDLMRVPLLHDESLSYLSKSPTWPKWFKMVGLDPRDAVRGTRFTQHAEQALDAAANGAGVVLGRKVLASKDIESGRLAMPFGPEMTAGAGYHIVCSDEKKDLPEVQAFFSWMHAEEAIDIAHEREATLSEVTPLKVVS